MHIQEVKKESVVSLSKLARKIIKDCPYYNEASKKEERFGYLEANILKNLKSSKDVYFLALQGKAVLGFCHGYFDSGTFWLSWIGVKDSHRRQGIGTEIIKHLEIYLRHHRVHKIWFDTITTNKESVNFFKKLGYRKIAHLDNHWCNLDYYLWQKFLK